MINLMIQIVKLKVKLGFAVTKLILKVSLVFLLFAGCMNLGQMYSERLGWFVFCLVLMMPIRFNSKKESVNVLHA